MRSSVRYSEGFKLQVLRELEEGRFTTRAAAARRYGIRGSGTIEYWARQYGKSHILGKVIRVETPQEINEARELRKRVRELEKALADAHLKGRFDEAYLRIACRAAGIEDVDEFKKKHAGKL
jgi:transposase-like protein